MKESDAKKESFQLSNLSSKDPNDDFLEDVISFKKNKSDKKELPFVNQTKVFEKLARTFSTQYPYAALVGDPGIGKSMILEYVSKILTGEVSMEELKKVSPKTVPLFKKIIKKATDYERYSYLTLPNLNNPLNVNLIPYLDEEKLHDSELIASSFGEDVSGFMNYFIQENPEKIKLSYDEKKFRNFCEDNIHDLYLDINRRAGSMILDKCSEYKNSILSFIELNFNPSESDIVSKWGLFLKSDYEKAIINHLKEDAGFKKERINISKEELESGLSNTVLNSNYKRRIDDLMESISQVDLDSDSKKTPFSIFEEEFKKYNKKLVSLKRKYNDNSFKNQKDLISELNKNKIYSSHVLRFSESTLDHVITGIEKIRDEYIYEEKDMSEDVKIWMNSVVDFFKENRKVMSKSYEGIWNDLEYKKEFLTKPDSGSKSDKEKKKDDEKDKELDNKNKKKGPYKNKANSHEYDLEFLLKHGKYEMPLEYILQPQKINSESTTENGITCNKIRSLDKKTLFGSYSKLGGDLPPHMTIDYLGSFFKGSILLFQDSFKDFIETIVSNEKESRGMKEQFLEYLQSGIMTVVEDNGVSYHIKSPKIILGCSNDDPFTFQTGPFTVKKESGLKSRFKTISVPSYTLNNKESREGSLKVLYNAIKEYGESHANKPFKISDKATNLLLKLNVDYVSGYVDLGYRSFVQKINDICAYAVSTGKTKIDEKLIKSQIKENLSITHFSAVDREKKFGKYFLLPEKSVGHVCGVSTRGDKPGGVFHVNSQYIPGFEEIKENILRFKMTDIESAMTDETTFKGYELVKNYVQTILGSSGVDFEKMKDKGNWTMKTHFGGNWSKMGGPSASMATAITVISAFIEDEIYKNRFVTGTLESMSGDCGLIGGTYIKSLIPYRLKQIEKELTGKSTEMYFLHPVGNSLDLKRDLLFDPFGVENFVKFLPVKDFAQAYFLCTSGQKITKKVWENSFNNSKDTMDGIYSKIKAKFN